MYIKIGRVDNKIEGGFERDSIGQHELGATKVDDEHRGVRDGERKRAT